jgi:NADPH2:quinone reductase
VDRVLEVTDGRGVDVILDLVAGALATDNLRATRIGGRVVNIGRVGGEKVTLDLDLHSMRRITYVGTTFRTRTPDEVADVVREADKALGPAVAGGRVHMPVSASFPLAEARDALDAMASNAHFGKLVLVP